MVELHFFACDYPVVLGALIEKTILSSLICLGTLVKNQMNIDICVFLDSHVNSIDIYIYPCAKTTLFLLLWICSTF